LSADKRFDEVDKVQLKVILPLKVVEPDLTESIRLQWLLWHRLDVEVLRAAISDY